MIADKDYEGSEKREYPRVSYPVADKPRLKIGKKKYEVIDISQRGLRFLKNEKGMLPQHVNGKLTLLCGESFSIEGSLIWEQDDDFALYLKNIIPETLIQKEKSYVQQNHPF
ncbi:MAG: PilZ domain-containing protein [Thermodesulfobacteriota bacterium]